MRYCYVNGRIVPASEASLPIADRGVRFGDGLFETVLVRRGVPYLWEKHLSRLQDGLEALNIDFDVEMLLPRVRELMHHNDVADGILRIMVTRGEGGQGYLPAEGAKPSLVIEMQGLRARPDAPVRLWLSRWVRPPAEALPVHAKTMQGLNSTLARMEAREQGCFEALMLNAKGEVAEASSANIFWFMKGKLYTPATGTGLLPGVIRERLMEISPIEIEEGRFEPTVLSQAEEVVLTNVAWGVLPVRGLLPMNWFWDREAVATTLQALLQEDVERYVDTHVA